MIDTKTSDKHKVVLTGPTEHELIAELEKLLEGFATDGMLTSDRRRAINYMKVDHLKRDAACRVSRAIGVQCVSLIGESRTP